MVKAKQRDLAGGPHMRAAAKLERDAANVDDPHDVAVLLAEEGHRARRDGVFVRHLPRLDRQILPYMRVHLGLDRGELLALDGTVMAEIETQPLGRYDRARLAHVCAQDFAQRGMNEVGGGVIPFDIAATRLVHLRERGGRLERLPERSDYGILAVDFFNAFNRQLPPVACYDPGVADLAARLGVKRILLEDQLELIAGLPECDGLSFSLGGVVTNPTLLALLLQLHPFATALPPFAAFRRRFPGRPRAPALLAERLLEALDVYCLPALASDHLREVDRESIGIVELERVVARNCLCALYLLHPRQPSFDRLEEALLFGARDALDVLFLGDELGIDVAHHARDGPGERRERGLPPAEQPRMAHGATQDPPEHVAAALVRGVDSISEEKCDRARVVGEHAERRARWPAIVWPADDLDGLRDDGLEQVRIEIRWKVLH